MVKQCIWIGDLPVAVLDGTSTPATPTLLFVHADHLKRLELMTNASGAVVWQAVYQKLPAGCDEPDRCKLVLASCGEECFDTVFGPDVGLTEVV